MSTQAWTRWNTTGGPYPGTPPAIGNRELCRFRGQILWHLADERGGLLCRPDAQTRHLTTSTEARVMELHEQRGHRIDVCPRCARLDPRGIDRARTVYIVEYDTGEPRWSSNACRFPTRAAAEAAGASLAWRWTLVRDWRVVEVAGDPTSYGVDGHPVRPDADHTDVRSCEAAS
jgi:hypothetical protein